MTSMSFEKIMERLSSEYLSGKEIDQLYIELEKFYENEDRHKYSVLSEIFYRQTDEDNELLEINLKRILKYAQNAEDKPLVARIEKLIDHLNLNIIHRTFIEGQAGRTISRLVVDAESINNKFKELEFLSEEIKSDINRVNELAEKLDNANKLAEKLSGKNTENEERFNKITTDFVAILGIFSAVILAMFGGVEIITGLMEELRDGVPASKLLFFFTLAVGAMVFIVFLLLNGIAKLTRFSLSSCKCKKRDECECNIVQRHPSIIMFYLVLLYMLFVSLTAYIY